MKTPFHRDALAALALWAAAPAAQAAFSLDDIHFWAGEGTNAAVVVVDWGREDASAVRAWGYRWDGASTAANALLALDAADPRLDVVRSISSYGLYLTGFTYRAPEGETYEATAEDYYDDSGSTGTYWSISSAEAGGEMAVSGSGASSLALVPGGRLGLKWTYYAYDYATFDYDGGDTSVAEDAALAAPAPAFAMDDLHFWIGEGTNRVALVVDFGVEGRDPRAWGYRWNGPATNLAELIAVVAHEDPRLGFHTDPSQADDACSLSGNFDHGIIPVAPVSIGCPVACMNASAVLPDMRAGFQKKADCKLTDVLCSVYRYIHDRYPFLLCRFTVHDIITGRQHCDCLQVRTSVKSRPADGCFINNSYICIADSLCNQI